MNSGRLGPPQLIELGEFTKGKGVPKKEITKKGLPCLTDEEIYTRHHDVIREFVSYIPEEVANESREIEYGDLYLLVQEKRQMRKVNVLPILRNIKLMPEGILLF